MDRQLGSDQDEHVFEGEVGDSENSDRLGGEIGEELPGGHEYPSNEDLSSQMRGVTGGEEMMYWEGRQQYPYWDNNNNEMNSGMSEADQQRAQVVYMRVRGGLWCRCGFLTCVHAYRLTVVALLLLIEWK